MTWSYSFIPSSSDKDAVRFLVGDIDVNAQLVHDEEIEYALSLNPEVRLAAATIAEAIAARFACCVDEKIGMIERNHSQKARAFRARAEELRRLASNLAEMFVGGLTLSGNRDLRADPDAVQPAFSVGMHDHPGTTKYFNNGDCCG